MNAMEGVAVTKGLTTEEAVEMAREAGFDHVGELNMDALEFLPEVRDMCAVNKCGFYGARWGCPPAIGTLEDSAALVSKYHRGIIIQTTGHLKRIVDARTMFATIREHNKKFERFAKDFRRYYPDCLPMGVGACHKCEECTYPDKPCRFPDSVFPSMEAYGLVVADVCKKSGLKYDYGDKTITVISCLLID